VVQNKPAVKPVKGDAAGATVPGQAPAGGAVSFALSPPAVFAGLSLAVS
jgi:hypothetical protein